MHCAPPLRGALYKKWGGHDKKNFPALRAGWIRAPPLSYSFRRPCAGVCIAWRAQFTDQHALFQTKHGHYWTSAIDACRGNSRALWSKLRNLMQPRAHTSNRLTADDFSQYFMTKIERIRTSTSASSPRIDDRVVSELLSELKPVTTDEIAKLLLISPAKRCLLDPCTNMAN